MVMLAKGNRGGEVTRACKEDGGFYLGSIGGPAAKLAQDNIKKVEVLDFPELGMEAVWKIDVVDFPAFVVVDDKGNDFFAETLRPIATNIPVGTAQVAFIRLGRQQLFLVGQCFLPVPFAQMVQNARFLPVAIPFIHGLFA